MRFTAHVQIGNFAVYNVFKSKVKVNASHDGYHVRVQVVEVEPDEWGNLTVTVDHLDGEPTVEIARLGEEVERVPVRRTCFRCEIKRCKEHDAFEPTEFDEAIAS